VNYPLTCHQREAKREKRKKREEKKSKERNLVRITKSLPDQSGDKDLNMGLATYMLALLAVVIVPVFGENVAFTIDNMGTENLCDYSSASMRDLINTAGIVRANNVDCFKLVNTHMRKPGFWTVTNWDFADNNAYHIVASYGTCNFMIGPSDTTTKKDAAVVISTADVKKIWGAYSARFGSKHAKDAGLGYAASISNFNCGGIPVNYYIGGSGQNTA
jgi:hypothetical protein